MPQVQAITTPPPQSVPLCSTDTSRAPKRGSILVVEDRDDVRQGLAQLLELYGFVVTDAADADRALEYLRSCPSGYALVLLDLQLPGTLSGAGLRIRQLDDAQLSAVPTVVVTACEVAECDRQLLKADAWLEKPFRFDELLEIVRRFVVPEGHTNTPSGISF